MNPLNFMIPLKALNRPKYAANIVRTQFGQTASGNGFGDNVFLIPYEFQVIVHPQIHKKGPKSAR